MYRTKTAAGVAKHSRNERRKRRASLRKPRSPVAKIDEGKLALLLEPLAQQRPESQEFDWDASHYAKKTKQGADRSGLEKSVPAMEHVLAVTDGNLYPCLPGLLRVLQQLDVKYEIMHSEHGKGDEVV